MCQAIAPRERPCIFFEGFSSFLHCREFKSTAHDALLTDTEKSKHNPERRLMPRSHRVLQILVNERRAVRLVKNLVLSVRGSSFRS